MNTLYKKVLKKYTTVVIKDNNSLEGHSNHRKTDKILTNINKNRCFVTVDFSSKSEDDFQKHFGNLFAHVESSISTLVVEENDDKISIKIYSNLKKRVFANRFFVKRKFVNFLTINKKTGNIYAGKYNKSRKFKNDNSVKCNPYNNNYITNFLHQIRNLFSEEMLLTANPVETYSSVLEVKKTVFNSLGIDLKYSIKEGLYQYRMNKIGVKLSDNFGIFLVENGGKLPTRQQYKKSEYNFIDTIMKTNGMGGKKLRRVLHSLKHFNGLFYNYVKSLFGEKYLKSRPDGEIKKILESTVWYNYSSVNIDDYETNVLERMTDDERERVWNIMMLLSKNVIQPFTFLDHIRYYFKLRGYGEDIKWKSYNLQTFDEEHELFSNRVSEYSNGTVNRIFDDKVVSLVEDPIYSFNGGVYYPVILKSTNDYVSESSIQHNCVRTYQKNETVLVSIREGSVDSEERASVEFKIQPYENEKVVMIQFLGRYNRPLETKWDFALESVLSRLKLLVPEIMNTKLIFNTKISETTYRYEYIGNGLNLAWVNNDGEKKYLRDNGNVGLIENLF